MKTVILYDGRPVKLPLNIFPEQKMLFDINGFLWKFTYHLNISGTELSTTYRYFSKGDFRQEDLDVASNYEGYYREADFYEYLRPNQVYTRGKLLLELKQKKYNFSNYSAKIGDLLTVKILDKTPPYLYYFRLATYTFQVEPDVNTTGVKNYRKEDFNVNDDFNVETSIDIPYGITPLMEEKNQNSTPDGKFYAHNFRGHNILNSSDDSIKGNYKKVYTVISFQIDIIVSQIFHNRLSSILDIQSIDSWADQYSDIVIDHKQDALSKLVFLLKKSWFYYYDPNAIENPDIPISKQHRLLPDTILDNWDIKSLWRYAIGLRSFYRTVWQLDLTESAENTKSTTFFSLLFNLPVNSLITFPYDGLIMIIEEFLKQNSIEEDHEVLLVRIVASIALLDERQDDFLEYLSETYSTGGDHNITRLEKLYKLVDDARIERYDIIGSIAEFINKQELNRKHLVFSIYDIWKKSKYNGLYVRPQAPGTSTYWEDKTVNKNLSLQFIKSETPIETATNTIQKVYNISSKFVGKEVNLRAITGYDYTTAIRNDGEGGYVSATTKTPRFSDLGNFPFYQPIEIFDYPGNADLDLYEDIDFEDVIDGRLTYPAFLLHYVNDYDKLAQFDALLNLTWNIAVEVTFFFASGGASSFRHIRHLSKLGRALFRPSTVLPSEVILVWRGIFSSSEIVSSIASSLASVAQYLIDIEDYDEDEKELAETLRTFFFWTSLATSGSSFLAEKMAFKASVDVGIVHQSLIDRGLINKIPPEVRAFLVKIATKTEKETEALIEKLRERGLSNEKIEERLRKLRLDKLAKANTMWNKFEYTHFFTKPPAKPCFLSGTLVKTDNKLQAIEEITVGQRVYARNMISGELELKMVTEVFRNYTEMYIRISAENDVIAATGQHRFWLPDENRWCMANSLEIGMALLTTQGRTVTILNLEIITETVDTYNLEVEDHHNYYVGNDEILVHNQTSRPSAFANPELIENVRFYKHFVDQTVLYIGQTIQGIGPRYEQHMNDYKSSDGTKKVWMAQEPGVDNIRINGMVPPYRMTRYEIAVTEMYEIYKAGGRQGIDPEGKLFNKQNPISKRKFNRFKNAGFNPCKFYV